MESPPESCLAFSGECVISSVLSCHNKNLKGWTLKPLARHSSQTDWVTTFRQTVSALGKIGVTALGQISVTVSFYLENKGKYIFKMWTHADPKDTKRRERESAHTRRRETPGPLAPLFYVFSPPLGPALCKSGQPGVLFVLPEVLTSVLRPSFVQFFQAFPFIVF